MMLRLLLCLLPLSNLNAAELGRLFFTPEQRSQIIQDHSQSSPISHTDEMLSGVVQRSDGRQTLWINNIAQSADGVELDLHQVGLPYHEAH